MNLHVCAKFGPNRTTGDDVYTVGRIHTHTQTHTHSPISIDIDAVVYHRTSPLLGYFQSAHVTITTTSFHPVMPKGSFTIINIYESVQRVLFFMIPSSPPQSVL